MARALLFLMLLWPGGTAMAAVPAPAPASCRASTGPGGQQLVCMDEFYEVLFDYGTWVEADRFGTLFCPDPRVVGADFRPFARGHWAFSESGWTFVGETPISWVTDHYGRWVRTGLPACRWGWVPGEIWSPAWVEFRVGENVIAWRPAPFDGILVRLNLPAGPRLPVVKAEPPGNADAALEDGYVAVQDSDFEAGRLREVTLSGPALHHAVAETAFLPDLRSGLHGRTRFEIVAQMQAAQGATAAAREMEGEAPEPARAGSRRGRGRPGVAGTVRTGVEKRTASAGPRPGDNPPGTGKVYGPTDPNQGNFQQPGPAGGVKVLEWGKPKPKRAPARAGGD